MTDRELNLTPDPGCPDCDHADLHQQWAERADAQTLLDAYRLTLRDILGKNSVLVQDDVGDARLLETALRFLGTPPLAEMLLAWLKKTGGQLIYRDLSDEGVAVRFAVQRKADETWPQSPQHQAPVWEMLDAQNVVPRGGSQPLLYSHDRRGLRREHEPALPALDLQLDDKPEAPAPAAGGYAAFLEDPADPKNQPHRPQFGDIAARETMTTCTFCGRPLLNPIHQAG